MPCFTASVSNAQILMGVFITAPGGGAAPAPIDEANAFRALVDTGATISCISERAAKQIGIAPVEKGGINTVGGVVDTDVYQINLHIPVKNPAAKQDESALDITLKNFSKMTVYKADTMDHFDMILGMDVIMAGSGLHVSGNSFTFCT